MATLGEYLGAGSGITKLLLHLNGNSTDSSGNNNNGTDTNITYSLANGKFGQGAGFNGSSSFISVPNTIFTTTPITFSWWANTNNAISGMILTNRNGAVIQWFRFLMNYNSGPATTTFGFSSRNSSYVGYDYTVTMTIPSGWNNFIVTINTGSNNVKTYLNGRLVGTGTLGSTDFYNSNARLIGMMLDYGTSGEYYNGSLDELIFENRAWSAEEVKKYYTYSKGRFGII